MEKLYFGQVNMGSAEFLGDKYYSVELADFPHAKFLRGNATEYEKYLQASWSYLKPESNSLEERQKQIEKFKNLLEDIKESGIKNPIIICEFKGRKIIVDGNHRSVIADFLSIELPQKIMPLPEYIQLITKNDSEFYGTGNRGIPYQSIFDGAEEIFKGRRSDILQRMDLIDRNDVEGKTILDIGCNVGNACFMAIDRGAKEAIGADVSEKMLTSALRLNVLFQKNCKFIKADFSKEQDIKADTAFAFSIDAHIKNNEMLAENLIKFPVVYFETHENRGIPQEVKAVFKEEFRGKLGDRSFYRLSK